MIGGDVTLGCLLGQYDKAQSFDVASKGGPLVTGDVGSWFIDTTAASVSFLTNVVHSSGKGVSLAAGSLGGAFGVVTYDYQKPNDAFARWSPDVTTHSMVVDFWGGLLFDGQRWVQDFIGGAQIAIFQTGLNHYRNSADISSGDGRGFRMITGAGTTTDAQFGLDDVLTQIDPITLHPTFETEHRQQLISEQQRTLGGRLYSTVWDKFFAYTLPLQFLPTSHADLINWWWENNFNLALTLGTSDSESIRICRIVNTQQPIGRRMSPYFDQWQGALLLESIDRGSLVF